MDENKIVEAVARALSERLIFREGHIHWTWYKEIAAAVMDVHVNALEAAGFMVIRQETAAKSIAESDQR